MIKKENHYSTISRVIGHIVEHKLQSHSLEEIAQAVGMSPGHLQKVFTQWVGITPKQFSRYLSLQYSKELLLQCKTTLDTAVVSGLSSSGRLHDLFITIEAMTPGEYKSYGKNLVIYYSTFDTKFGLCLVASTPKGISNIVFFNSVEESVEDLKKRWPYASLIQKNMPEHDIIQNYFSGISTKSEIKFHLRGTNFQIKVWEALLSISEGTISSYSDMAIQLGDKKLSRAVGTAVGENPISYIIPCHRVLKSTGEISGYRWGIERKRVMLAYEAIKKEK